MLFLNTQIGLVAGKYIVRISAVNVRPTGNYHEIDFVHGGEPRSTRASEQAVQEFLISNSAHG